MHPNPTSDHELLLNTRRGHEPSARLLWDRHAPRLTAYAAAIVGRCDAPDVVQSVMCAILALPRRRLAEVTDPPAWLALLTRRTALNHLRSARRERTRRAARAPELPPPTSAAAPAPDLQSAVDALPRRLREVVVLKHVAGLTFGQIATALATNRNTAATRYRAAVAALRRILDQDENPVPAPLEVTHAR
jgi:RNA polymerase sigma-70 factor (ECF subfamily)